MLNKKGVGEGFTWAAGLIVILIIIALSYIAYTFGHIGQKNPVTISTTTTTYSYGFNRLATYLVSADFNSTKKGEILYKFYSDTQQLPGGAGLAIHYPNLLNVGLSYKVYYNPIFKFSTGFYLSCRACPNEYSEFVYGWEARNAVKF